MIARHHAPRFTELLWRKIFWIQADCGLLLSFFMSLATNLSISMQTRLTIRSFGLSVSGRP